MARSYPASLIVGEDLFLCLKVLYVTAGPGEKRMLCLTESLLGTAVASMRRTKAPASVKFYQILSIFIFFIRLIILEDFIRLISYNGPCVHLGCSFFLATALLGCSIVLSQIELVISLRN